MTSPAMPPRLRRFYATLCLGFLFIALVPLFRELTRRPDIWWTPRPMLLPLAAGQERVEIYLRGEPLPALLQARQVRIVAGEASTVLTTEDVGLRFNNWDRVRARSLPVLLASAFGAAVAGLSFLLIVTGRLAYRPERPWPAS